MVRLVQIWLSEAAVFILILHDSRIWQYDRVPSILIQSVYITQQIDSNLFTQIFPETEIRHSDGILSIPIQVEMVIRLSGYRLFVIISMVVQIQLLVKMLCVSILVEVVMWHYDAQHCIIIQ